MGVCHVFGTGATESGSVMTCLVERSLHRLVIIGDGGDNTNHAKHLDSVLDGEDRTLLEMQCSRVLCSYAMHASATGSHSGELC